VFGFITCPSFFGGIPPGCTSGIIVIAPTTAGCCPVIWVTYISEIICTGGCGGGLRATGLKAEEPLALLPPPSDPPILGKIPSGTKPRGVFGLSPGTQKTTALFENGGQLFLGAGSKFHITQDFKNLTGGTMNVCINTIFNSIPQAGQIVLEVGTLFSQFGGILQVLPTTNIPNGTMFTIVKNLAHVWTGGFTIQNIHFSGPDGADLPEGATFYVNGMEFQLSYNGGFGDITITKIEGVL